MDIQLKELTKRFKSTIAVDEMDLHVQDEEFITLLGPSGCGKTTTLRLIAGFLKPDGGEILVGGEVVSSPDIVVPPEKRNVGMVFQSYALWPHMNVYDNVAFGLKMRKKPKQEIDERTKRALDLVQLSSFADRFPHQLSGGQQQRVALARATAIEPAFFLLDEPLSNLDAKLRHEMRFEIRELQKKLHITTLYVTHDQAEALVISDRIAVVFDGKIEEVSDPRSLYERPKSVRVAEFMAQENFIKSSISETGSAEEYAVVCTESGTELQCRIPFQARKNEKILVSIRPEYIEISKKKLDIKHNLLVGTIKQIAYLGAVIDYRILSDNLTLRVNSPAQLNMRKGDRVYLHLDPERLVALRSA